MTCYIWDDDKIKHQEIRKRITASKSFY